MIVAHLKQICLFIGICSEEEECVDGDIEESNVCDSVPKLVISEDGQINIDQSSLIVSRNVPQPKTTEVVRVDETTYSSFRKRPLTKHWTAKGILFSNDLNIFIFSKLYVNLYYYYN